MLKAYPSMDKKDFDIEGLATVWHLCFKEEEYSLANAALITSIKECAYFPSVADFERHIGYVKQQISNREYWERANDRKRM